MELSVIVTCQQAETGDGKNVAKQSKHVSIPQPIGRIMQASLLRTIIHNNGMKFKIGS